MFNDKKGQAALEFLMTYGWAILAAVIVIGALAYFGVFSPGQYAPETCTLTAPLGCDEYNVQTTGPNLVIRNGRGESIDILNVNVEGCGDYEPADTTVPNGQTLTASPDCALTEGSRFRGDITVTYQITDGTLNQTSTGQISGTVV